MVALLNLVDFGDADISYKATQLVDKVIEQLCLHVFDDACISPQGRVYWDVIVPHRQSVQAMLHYLYPDMPFSNGENMWSVCFATSCYKPPKGLRERMKQPLSTTYTSGNARIRIDKTQTYMLTSVDCPRDEGDKPDWVNLCFVKGADRHTNAYVKSLNERFHGTTVFEPGVYGYQQHLWYAALSKACVVFATLPGSPVDDDHMRPGYWHGNGIFPALRQQGNQLACIYDIPSHYPIVFTHLFFPTALFDNVCRSGKWLFGQKGEGAIGIWCSGDLVAVDDVLSQCEYRCYDTTTAYYCVMGTCHNAVEFERFKRHCEDKKPFLDTRALSFSADGLQLVYHAVDNQTQYI